MFNKIVILATVLSALTNVGFAVPTSTSSVPEVVPGPGLPSLASLGLTSADLNIQPASLSTRAADYTPTCQTYSTAEVNDVISCFNYLVAIGNNDCTISGDKVVFCQAGDAGIGGINDSGGSSVTSSCYDVALAVQWVFTYCNYDGYVGGSNAAYGNGNLVVTVDNISYLE